MSPLHVLKESECTAKDFSTTHFTYEVQDFYRVDLSEDAHLASLLSEVVPDVPENHILVYSEVVLPRFHSKKNHRSGALGAELAAERLMGRWPVVSLAGCEVSTHNSQPLRS